MFAKHTERFSKNVRFWKLVRLLPDPVGYGRKIGCHHFNHGPMKLSSYMIFLFETLSHTLLSNLLKDFQKLSTYQNWLFSRLCSANPVRYGNKWIRYDYKHGQIKQLNFSDCLILKLCYTDLSQSRVCAR
jgi:hypothetical protein